METYKVGEINLTITLKSIKISTNYVNTTVTNVAVDSNHQLVVFTSNGNRSSFPFNSFDINEG